MIIQIVRHKPRLSHDEVNQRFVERSDRYQKVPGLIQKYYARFTGTGEYTGVYVWDSQESLDAWRAGHLSGTLAETYPVHGEPVRELADVMPVLREDGSSCVQQQPLAAAADQGDGTSMRRIRLSTVAGLNKVAPLSVTWM